MSHTTRGKKQLLHRVRRLGGQIEAIERLLDEDRDCFEVLQQIAAARGSMNGLMAEVLEGHIRFHVAGSDNGHRARRNRQAIEELVSITRSYLR